MKAGLVFIVALFLFVITAAAVASASGPEPDDRVLMTVTFPVETMKVCEMSAPVIAGRLSDKMRQPVGATCSRLSPLPGSPAGLPDPGTDTLAGPCPPRFANTKTAGVSLSDPCATGERTAP